MIWLGCYTVLLDLLLDSVSMFNCFNRLACVENNMELCGERCNPTPDCMEHQVCCQMDQNTCDCYNKTRRMENNGEDMRGMYMI